MTLKLPLKCILYPCNAFILANFPTREVPFKVGSPYVLFSSYLVQKMTNQRLILHLRRECHESHNFKETPFVRKILEYLHYQTV